MEGSNPGRAMRRVETDWGSYTEPVTGPLPVAHADGEQVIFGRVG